MQKYLNRISPFVLYGGMLFYLYILLKIILFKYVSFSQVLSGQGLLERSLNLIPLRDTFVYLFGNEVPKTIALLNVFGNIVLFVPAGIYLQMFFKNLSVLKSLIILGGFSLFFEMCQFVFCIGTADIDDLILNTLGGFAGVWIYRGLLLLLNSRKKAKCLVTWGALLFACIAFMYLFQPFQKDYRLIKIGEEYYAGSYPPDVIGTFISFDGDILTVENTFGISGMVCHYTDELIQVVITEETRLAKSTIYEDRGNRDTYVVYERLFIEDLKDLDLEASVSFDIIERGETFIAQNLCVSYLALEDLKIPPGYDLQQEK